MKRFFSPLRLPFALPELHMHYLAKAFLFSGIRLFILSMWGAFIYMLSRGRLWVALAIFCMGMICSAFHAIEFCLKWLNNLCYLAEPIQFIVSIYVGYRVKNGVQAIDLVEQIELVDRQGNVLSSYEKPVEIDQL